MNRKGILRYESAHLIPHNIAGTHFYMVVLSKTDHLNLEDENNGKYNGHLVKDMSEAFEIATHYNVPLYDGGEQLLEGDFQ